MKKERKFWVIAALLAGLSLMMCAPPASDEEESAKAPAAAADFEKALAADANIEEAANFSARAGEMSAAAVNYRVQNEVVSGGWKFWSLGGSGVANRPFVACVTPISGDPDLYVFQYNSSLRQWVILDYSLHAELRSDSAAFSTPRTERIFLGVRGFSASNFFFSVSWETSDHLFALDVPYIRQQSISPCGNSMCSAASTVMVLAYWGQIKPGDMATEATKLFSATGSCTSGLLSRSGLAQHLMNNYDFTSVEFKNPDWQQLFELIKTEIQAGHPLILGSRSMSSIGHYITVVGYQGNQESTASLIINDPYGNWLRRDVWDTSASGEGRVYNYRAITAEASDGVFVIKE